MASVESEIAFHGGLAAYSAGDLEKARLAFRQVVDEDPEDTAALRFLALIARDQDRTIYSILLFERAVAVDPEDPDLHFDLATTLLLDGRPDEALAAFDRALAIEPDNAPAQLGAGIAAVRTGASRVGLAHLQRALELDLDPALRDKAQYYTGLAEINLGDPTAAAGTFSNLEIQSPQSPLVNSARIWREGLEAVAPAPHPRWALSLTGGAEYDSNPTLVGGGGTGDEREDDARFVARLQGNYELIQGERFSLAAGYDGYLGVLANVSSVDLQTHTAFVRGTWDADPVRLDLRYDFAYSWIELDVPFRLLHRVTASATLRESDMGHTQFYVQLNQADFKNPGPIPEFNRNGPRYATGINQWLYTPEAGPLSYLRAGVAGDFYDTEGGDFSYKAGEASGGFGLALPWDTTCAFLYRHVWRFYDEFSLTGDKRNDRIQFLSLDISKELGEHWTVTLGGSATLNESDDPFFDYDRYVIGSYASYDF